MANDKAEPLEQQSYQVRSTSFEARSFRTGAKGEQRSGHRGILGNHGTESARSQARFKSQQQRHVFVEVAVTKRFPRIFGIFRMRGLLTSHRKRSVRQDTVLSGTDRSSPRPLQLGRSSRCSGVRAHLSWNLQCLRLASDKPRNR